MLGVKRAGRLPVFKRAKRMAMSGLGLMRGVCVVLANLIMARGLAMKMRRHLVMRRRRMMGYWIVCCGHDLTSLRR